MKWTFRTPDIPFESSRRGDSPHALFLLVVFSFLILGSSLLFLFPLNTRAADTTTGIDHFLGLSWGSDTGVIRARMGPPAQVSRLGDGGRVYAYREEEEETNSEQTEKGSVVERTHLFYVHSNQGLVRGMVKLELPPDRPCLNVFRRWRDRLAQTYPGLPSREDKIEPPEGLSFCEARVRGQSRWAIRWEDQWERYVVLSLEGEGLTVNVSTPAFESWLRRK